MPKFLYFSNFKVDNFINTYVGSGIKIKIQNKDSKLILGRNFYCRDNVILNVANGKLQIGDGVFFNNNCSLNCRDSIIIGNDCLFGEGVKIYDHDHEFRKKGLIKEQGFVKEGISIGNNVWVGSNCVILKGVTIGDNVVISAGTIVRENVPDNCIAYNKLDFKIKEVNYK